MAAVSDARETPLGDLITSTDADMRRLFVASCLALTATSFSFAAIAGAMFGLKGAFALSNEQIGLIGGAALWGMAIAQLLFSPLCDAVGPKRLLLLACAGHLAGVVTMIVADGFATLFIGALIISIGNGVVEAVCNPLVAALYPDRKAVMLNRFHFWFPGGIVIGGLTIWAFDQFGMTAWQLKILIVVPPALGYAALAWREQFPPTETARVGIGVSGTVRALLMSPLMWLMLGLMAITASLELGPNRWIPAVLEAGGLPGILILVLINGVMALTRWKAHAVFTRVSPPLLLAGGCALASIGLLALSYASGLGPTLGAALVFALGVSMLWPTMIALVSERLPQTGALGLGLIAASGSAVVGLLTTPMLGRAADVHLLDAVSAVQVASVAGAAGAPPPVGRDQAVILLRTAAAGERGESAAIVAQPILRAADNRAGLLAFRGLVPIGLFAALIFVVMVIVDRRRGGYDALVARARGELVQ